MASNHSSQRSRVKGTLEIYHAYISDSSTVDNDNGDAATDSGGWEMVQPVNVNRPMQTVTCTLCFKLKFFSNNNYF